MSEKRLMDGKVLKINSLLPSTKKGAKKPDAINGHINNSAQKKVEKTIINENYDYKKKVKTTRRNSPKSSEDLTKAENDQRIRIDNLEAVLDCAGGPVFSVDRKLLLYEL